MISQNSRSQVHQNGGKNGRLVMVMVPFPAQGHLNQLLHLTHRITAYDVPVHYAGSTTHNHQAKLRLHGWDSTCLSHIHFHDFDLPSFSSPPPNPDATTPFPEHLQPLFDASLNLRQPVCQLLHELAPKFKRVIVIYDSLMSFVVQDVKCITNAEAYYFVPVSAFTMFLHMWDAMPEKPFQLDSEFPTCIPSLEAGQTTEIVDFVDYQFRFLLDLHSGTTCSGGSDCKMGGSIYNTSRLIEGKYVQLLERLSFNDKLKHFAIGPLNPVEMKTITSKDHRHECLQWLDKQEQDSVIYISFGSTTTMSDEQITELALGLETSQQKFIWVLRKADKGDIFVKDEANLLQLPKGYEGRVGDRGMVVRDWAPQLEILAHPSTGGFMSHCGWNSCMESISMGVPIAAWPMHSDQPRNAVLVAEVLKIGTMVRNWEEQAKLVLSGTIDSAVRKLMQSKEGAEMRKRASELGQAVRGPVSKIGVSTSTSEFESFIDHITR